MFVALFAEIVVALQVLTTDILALKGAIGIFGSISISACVTLFVNLWLVSIHCNYLDDGDLKFFARALS